MIDSNNTGGVEGGGAAAVDVEERGAEHGKCTDQPCTQKDTEYNKSKNTLSRFLFFEEATHELDKKTSLKVHLAHTLLKTEDMEFKRS